MHLGMDGGVFYRARWLQNETGDAFYKSHQINNAYITKCILYFFDVWTKTACFQVSTTSWKCEFSMLFVQPTIFSFRGSNFEVFTFSTYTEYVKRESIVMAWVKKQNSLLFTNVHVFYVLEDKTSKKKFRLPACLSVCMFADFWCGNNNFRRS